MDIPEWLSPYINKTCPFCGAPIANNQLLTDRYCTNPECKGHMAYKVEALAKRFGCKNVGPATAREAIELHKWKYHVEAIPWMLREKPELHLYEIGEICMIKGHQKKWREYCAGHSNMIEVIKDPNNPQVLRDNAYLLIHATQYVKLIPDLEGKILHVMMTGSFDGYRSRNEWLAEMNRRYGDVVQLQDVGKRKTGVDYLVKEKWAADHEKSNIAQKAGITIVSPDELEERLKWYHTYIIEGGERH